MKALLIINANMMLTNTVGGIPQKPLGSITTRNLHTPSDSQSFGVANNHGALVKNIRRGKSTEKYAVTSGNFNLQTNKFNA